MVYEKTVYDIDKNEFPVVGIRMVGERTYYTEKTLNTPMDIIRVMAADMCEYDREHLIVVNCDSKMHPINCSVCSIGSTDSSVVFIPNVLKTAILSNAAGIILLHNHPSGDCSPSMCDVNVTRRVQEACKLMGFKLFDHIVIGDSNSYYSFNEHQML